MISFSGVVKRYPGGQDALRGVSFGIEQGEFAFITGHSGAGKSTLLKLIPAIERPSSGAILVNGQNVGALKRAALPYLRRNLGLVFQDQKLLYDRSVYDNVMLPLAFGELGTREAARRARAALEKVGLLAREKANPIQLSGGEQQRLAIARAVVNRPAVLIADEPTANLDAESAAAILEIFAAFNQVGVTVLVATHDEALIRRFAKRVLRLAKEAWSNELARMKSWLRHHRQAVAAALGKLAAQKAAAALNALAIGIALSLPAGGYALLSSLRAVALEASLEPQLSVFLRPDAKRADADALGERLKSEAGVREFRFISREQALKELQATEGLGEVVAALNRNPLPDAFVVRPRTADAETLDALARELRALPAVAHVQMDSAWARRLGALAGTARLAIALLAALLAFGLVAITFNTIRLQILTQRAEIEISKLIGATDAFIRRPFYYLGALQGLAGGLLALAILWGSLTALNVGVSELAASYGSGFRLAFLAPGDALAVALFSMALGWFGAYLSVSKYLLEIEPR